MNLSDQTLRLEHESIVNTKLIGGTLCMAISYSQNGYEQP